jgi:hypothetical protein
MRYIKGFEMIPKIFKRPKIIIDYLFQAEWYLGATFLPNQNYSIRTDFKMDLMSVALRCCEIILKNSVDIFSIYLPLKEFVELCVEKIIQSF